MSANIPSHPCKNTPEKYKCTCEKSKQVKKYIFSLTDVKNIKTCDNKEKQNLRAYHCYEMYFKIGFAKLWNHDTVIVEYCDMKQETKNR